MLSLNQNLYVTINHEEESIKEKLMNCGNKPFFNEERIQATLKVTNETQLENIVKYFNGNLRSHKEIDEVIDILIDVLCSTEHMSENMAYDIIANS